MLEEPPILTIKAVTRRPTDAQAAAFQGVPTGFVVDAMKGGGALERTIRHIGRASGLPLSVAGPALTVDCGPGDVLAALASPKFVKPGDVVVSAFGGFQGCAAGGDRLCGMLRNNYAAGFVTDGPVRDFDGIVGVGLPVWCTGLTPSSPFTTGPGSIGFAIQIGGQEVESGDMIVADGDGVVVVPVERIDEIAAAIVEVRRLESELDRAVADGLKIQPRIEALLHSDAVKYVSQGPQTRQPSIS